MVSLDLDLEHVAGSGVPGTKSHSSLVSKKCPGQELCGPENGQTVGHEFYTCSYRIRQAGMDWNCKITAVEVGGRGTQNAITFNI